MKVEYTDPYPNGLASLVGGLIEANLERDPGRHALLRTVRVGLVARDADVSTTVLIEHGRVRIANGIAARTLHILIRCDGSTLVELAASPLRFGVPDPATREGRRLLWELLRRRIRIEGQFRHPRRLAGFSRLLSVA